MPVAGVDTIRVMNETNTTVLAVDAGRTLFLDRDLLIQQANDCGVAIVGIAAETEDASDD